MTILIAFFSFLLGLLAGYQLPILLAWWREYHYRKTFELSALRPYHPPRQMPGIPLENSSK
jgi:hypothetical protein